ncbi:lysophosphatidic acid receptor 6 [Cottoperca gobio]|uniref:Lysophosphatidic acid receptor 6 n=1 Tax=Cottoperca gobio TaxID=56716 RepID=A0A6J2RN91_COTGO|nr:lysophosphatidic acid receptor 6-like [Cottoperca gobio]
MSLLNRSTESSRGLHEDNDKDDKERERAREISQLPVLNLTHLECDRDSSVSVCWGNTHSPSSASWSSPLLIIRQVIMSNNSSNVCHNDSAGHNDIFRACIYSFISIVGLIFNLLALVFFFSHTKSRSQTIVYMTNLSIADVLLILTLPMRICYYLGVLDLSQWMCEVLGLVLKANMYGSIFLLTCMCFDRCMAVTFPMSHFVQEGRKKAPLVCFGIWILTFGASLPIYLSKRKEVFHKDCFDSLPVYATNPAVVLPTLFVGFGIPLVIMLICSLFLIHAVRRSSVAQTNLVDSGKIQRMIATSILIFLLSFLPYHVILALLSLHREDISCPMQVAYRYSLMLACLNTVLDPIAYYFTTDTFRRNIEVSAVRMLFPLNSQSSDVNRSRMPNS